MTVYKLKTLANDDLYHPTFADYWFDVDRIYGFLIPINPETEEQDLDLINIYHGESIDTIKQEKHIIDYLNEKFVIPAIKSN